MGGSGITDNTGRLRAVPSAGATYPLEIFIVCGQDSVEEVSEGVYRYYAVQHSLTLHCKGDIRLALARAALSQEFIYEAPVDHSDCSHITK